MPKLTFPEQKYAYGAREFLAKIFIGRKDDSGSSAKEFVAISTVKTEVVRAVAR